MKTKGFTLVEVLISIFIFALIMMLLYKSVSNLKQNNKNLNKTIQRNRILSKTIKLLKEDLILSKSFSSSKTNENDFFITTLSSIHNIAKPKVEWKILKNKKLVRFESNFIDDTLLKCKKLKIVQSNNKDNFLIYLKLENNQEIITEVINK